MTALRLGLIGAGISRSPSPAMHGAALRAHGLAGVYELFEAAPAELPGLLLRLRAGELRGCNVTVPYKFALASACDELEGDAQLCGAVNTITAESGALIGDNTDAHGFELALSLHRVWPAAGCRAVVLGAGGAASAVVLALSRVPAADIAVVARRRDPVEQLCERCSPATARAVDWGDGAGVAAALAEAGIVVNATPSGVAGMPFAVKHLPPDCVVVDVRYRPRPVDLVEAAAGAGRPACDGLEMLLFQGMLSFQRWTGLEPPWQAARAALHEAVAQ